ncbi:MAG: L,D-transpeptidase [Pseudobdellovibrionaceae bacterium]
MFKKIFSLSVLLACLLHFAAIASAFDKNANTENELNPFDPHVEELLQKYDQIYEEETGVSPFIENLNIDFTSTCFRDSCKIWLQAVKSTQMAYLFIDGQLVDSWKISSGAPGHDTPDFDKHPEGRIYDAYSSTKFPGGDYKALGNMPYAVFIEGGFAVHGTPAGNWRKLGKKASHGCIRMHPENAKRFNRLVRKFGIYQTWITVQN